ncbi:tyrosine--tRNA ligase 1, cytoplasmic-like [Lolium rigidum]|uniref:tyrosine--tRNA ligase 1, cytoplasmic-like n=1 Tax=Lolium rigidum TaxID=89674 RepID=UPI001F5C23F1|nr:tyrosine--tRNA ligase 1, cytoplasmic-like [Lolium rigidum]
MLSRAFTQVLSKGSKCPLDLFVHASAAVRFGSNMPRHHHHLLRQGEPPDVSPQRKHPLQNSRGATPTCTFESNWTLQHSFSTMKNSDDTPLDSIRATAGGSSIQRFASLKSVGECDNESELMLLLRKKTVPICYVWCDPSPWIHITQGFSMSINVNKMIRAGFKVKLLMADWFARMEPMIGGNLCKMQTIAMYNIEMWKATGMDVDGVEFVMLSDEISYRADEYWPLAMKVGSVSELEDIKKCLFSFSKLPKDTRGRGSVDSTTREFTPAETLQACLQCASILLQEVDIWLLDEDKRGVDMLVGEYRKHTGMKKKPVTMFQGMVPSLLQNTEWYNMGDPGWAIFMEDDEEVVSRKIEKAFCPPKLVAGNPCLEYVKYTILPCLGKFEVGLKEADSGNKTFLSMEDLTDDYSSGAVCPADMKHALVKAINTILQPVRDHFRSSSARKLRKAMEDNYIIDRAKRPYLKP